MENKIIKIIIYAALIITGRIISSFFRIKNKKNSTVKNIFKDYTAIIVSIIQVISMSLPILEYYYTSNGDNIILTISGIMIIIIGYSITVFANKEINKNWSPIIEKDNTQELVTTGIYKLIRHPLYFSGVLIILGTILFFKATYCIALIIIYFCVIIWRINKEELKLIKYFDEKYLEYKKCSKKIMPFIY